MGIYIKGMEMPANCFLCPLSVLNGERLFCEVTKEEVVRAKRSSDCPLVPVPPHGRLIDGDELASGCDDPHWCRWLSEIEDAPTIIPAEEW